MSHRFVCLLAVLLYIFLCKSALLAQPIKFDFEDGTLQGWIVVSGDVGKQPVSIDDDRYGGNFNKHGRYFIGTYENTKDEGVATFRSPEFTITTGYISLLVGGGFSPQGEYIALKNAANGAVIEQATGRNSEKMQRRTWDVTPYIGKRVYLEVVDAEKGGWGHVNVDDICELSSAEAKVLLKEREAQIASREPWVKSLSAPTKRTVYSGNALEDLVMPLGGVGAGNIGICGDGMLRQWQIFNKVNTRCVVPGQFFAVWAKSGSGEPVTRLLQKPSIHGMTEIQDTEFIGEFPIAEIRYRDPALPVNVSMEAFSPFIPMNSRDSGIPGIFFVFKVKNPGKEAVSVSLLASLQNAVGYDGISTIEGVNNPAYGGNANKVLDDPNGTIVDLYNPTLASDEHQNGTMALSTLTKNAHVVEQYDSLDVVWSDFASDGTLSMASKTGESDKGSTWNSAISSSISLKPGEQKDVVFFITWHFPNYYADYDVNLGKGRIGRMYNQWFECACKAASYMAANYPRLSKETHLFRDTLFDSNLPYWFTNRVSAPISTLTSQTCLWVEDGSFNAFEGCGCCPMNCTHVWNYEMTLSALFPDLERSMRNTDLLVQQEPSGAIRHRTVLPLSAPRETGPFTDGHLGTILKSYREYQRSADGKWLAKTWPRIKAAMDFVLREWDKDADGVILNEQWNTYDAAMYGPNTFIGTLYLGALRAAEEMAKVQGDAAAARIYRSVYETGRQMLDSTLWNGEYYTQISTRVDAEKNTAKWLLNDWPKETLDPGANRPYGIGCHADQLLGQWWATILDMDYLLPQERVRKALDSIMKYDWRWDFGDVAQQRAFAGEGDKGLLICTWPKGDRPKTSILYADEDWTGIDYEVAGLLIHEGKILDAYKIIKAIEDRYNGVRRSPITRSPWNEIECGDHYARAMSSWSILLAAQGMTYCGPKGTIGFDPRIQPDNHRSFFSAAEGWGTFAQKRDKKSQTDTLTVKYGKVMLRQITLTAKQTTRPKSVVIRNGKTQLPATVDFAKSRATVKLKSPVVVKAGETLSVSMSW